MNDGTETAGRGVALVTGGARRIGRAFVLALARSGWDVAVHYNGSHDAARETALDASALGVRAMTVRGDLADESTPGRVFGELDTAGWRVTCLVNNASVFPPSRLETLDGAEFSGTMAVNALAPLLLAREFAARTARGVIVNILDSRIGQLDLGHVSYQLSKTVLASLTMMMATAHAPGIRVNGIAPGMILPPEGRDESYLAGRTDKTLLGCFGAVEDVTRAVMYLVDAAFVTGEILTVDGGQAMKGLDFREEV